MRPLSDDERQFLSFVLAQPLKGSAELLSQVAEASAELRDTCGCPSLMLAVDRTRAAPAVTTPRVHFEARAKLADGSPVDVTVHIDQGYLKILEFVAYTPTEHFDFSIADIKAVELFGWDEDDAAGFPFRSRIG